MFLTVATIDSPIAMDISEGQFPMNILGIHSRQSVLVKVLAVGGAVALMATMVAPAQAYYQPTYLSNLVDQTMLNKERVAVARGDTYVDVGDSRGGSNAIGWQISEELAAAHVRARCTGLCASSAANVVIGSGGCIVGRHGQIVLHIAYVPTWTPELNEVMATVSKQEMVKHGIPSDIVERTYRAQGRMLVLRDDDMRRVGCTLE